MIIIIEQRANGDDDDASVVVKAKYTIKILNIQHWHPNDK